MDEGGSEDITRKPSIGRQDDLPRPTKERRPIIAARAPSGDAYPAAAGMSQQLATPHDTPRDGGVRPPSFPLTSGTSASPSAAPAQRLLNVDVDGRSAAEQLLASVREGRVLLAAAVAASAPPPPPPAPWPPPATVPSSSLLVSTPLAEVAAAPAAAPAAALAAPAAAPTAAPAAAAISDGMYPPPPSSGSEALAPAAAPAPRPPPSPLDQVVGPAGPLAAPQAAFAPPRQAPRHAQALSNASSVFDECDGDSQEQDLARRSARMYPRITPAGPPAVTRAPSSAAALAAPSDLPRAGTGAAPASRHALFPTAADAVAATTTADSATLLPVLLQLQLQLQQQQQVLMQNGLLGPQMGSMAGYSAASASSDAAAAVVGSPPPPPSGLPGASPGASGVVTAALPLPLFGSTTSSVVYASDAMPACSLQPPQPLVQDELGVQQGQTQQKALQEQYLSQWSAVRAVTATGSGSGSGSGSGTGTGLAVAAAAQQKAVTAPSARSESGAAPVTAPAQEAQPQPSAAQAVVTAPLTPAELNFVASLTEVASPNLNMALAASQLQPQNIPSAFAAAPLLSRPSGVGGATGSAGDAAGGTGGGGPAAAMGAATAGGAEVGLQGQQEAGSAGGDGSKGDKEKRAGGAALPSAEAVAENLVGNIDAIAIFEQEEDEDDSDLDDEPAKRWYQRPAVLWFLFSVGLGLALLVVGVILHTHLRDAQDAFRWCYFFAAMPLLYYALSYASLHVFNLIEWWFFRESLLYLKNVQHHALWLLFFLTLLPWYYTVFRWAWCASTAAFPNRCHQAAYLQATRIVWNILLCLMLFCLANLLKAVLAKLLTTHFYRTAHFKKLKNALEKEFALQVLSRPRRFVLAERTAGQQQLGTDGNHQRTWHNITSFLYPHHHPHGQDGAGAGAAAATGAQGGGAGAEVGGVDPTGRIAAAAAVASPPPPSVTVTFRSDGHLNEDRTAVQGSQPASTAFNTQRMVPPISEEGEEAVEVEQGPAQQGKGGPAVGTGGGGDGGGRASGAAAPYDPVGAVVAATSSVGVAMRPLNTSPLPPPASAAAVAARALAPAAAGLPGPPSTSASASVMAAIPGGGSSAAPLSPAELPPNSPASSVYLARPSGPGNTLQPSQPLQLQPGLHLQLQPGNQGPGNQGAAAVVSPFRAPSAPQQPLTPKSGHSGSQRGGNAGPGPGAGGGGVGGGGGNGGIGSSGSAPEGRGGLLPGALGALLSRRDSHESRTSKASALKPPARAATANLADAAAARVRKGSEALTQAMVEAVAPGAALSGQKQGLRHLSDAELEKVRTAIVIKTQSALISKYTDRSDEDMAKELGRVRRFANALFFNVLPPDSDRDYLTLGDFVVFFEAAEGASAGGVGAAAADTPGPDGRKAASFARPDGNGKVDGEGTGPGANTAKSTSLPRDSKGPSAAGGRDGKPIGRMSLTAAGDPARAKRLRERQRAAEAAAKKAFAYFDADSDGQVSRSEVREAVVNIYKERRNMARSLKDTETIVQSLEFGIGVVIHFVFAAVYLLIWGVDLLTGFSTFSATVLALTFVFGNSVKNMYESMLFLFVTHPYDVGDCILIGVEMYRVKKISLLYTDMVKSSGERMYMPNTALITQGIINWTRSKTKSESARLVCDIGVAWEVREDIQAALRSYAREHPTEFDGEPSCNFRELADPLKVVLVCSWTYNFAPDEFSRLGPARNGMLFIVQSKAREHRLVHTTYTDSPHD